MKGMKHKRSAALLILAMMILFAECGTFGPWMSLAASVNAASASKNMGYIKNPDYKSPYYIVVYTGSQSAVVYGKDKNGHYNRQIKAFTVSTGRKSRTPTRTGMYKIRAQYRWKTLMGPCYGQYSSSISENYLFHSVPYAKKTVNSLYNSYYDNLGKDVSHGCIRMCVRDCKWIYDNCPVGTQVRVVTASGPAGDPVPKRKSGAKYSGWDPSDKWAAGNPYFKDGEDETVSASPSKPVTKPKTYEVSLQQNISLSIRRGDSVSFSFRPEGIGLEYTWYFKKAGQNDWSEWKGRIGSTETVTPNDTWNGIQIYCGAKDSTGKVLSSGVAKIAFSDLITVLAQPKNVSVKSGEKASFSFPAEGAGLSWQWYYKKAAQTSWTLWKGHNRSSETAAANASWDGMQMYCAVSNSAGQKVRSQAVKVCVTDALAITRQPSAVSAKTGNTVRFRVQAKGEGIKYQWYYKKSGAKSWTKWKSAVKPSASLKAAKKWNGAKFRCVVKDGSGKSVTTKTVKLTVKKK